MSSDGNGTDPPDRFVTVDGMRLRYWQGGSGERAILLVHGVGGYVERWRRTFEVLSRRFRVYAMDLPGHGLSDKPQRYSYHAVDLAKLVRRFAGAVGLSSCRLVGSSLGGAIAAHYARLYPDAVERLVLSSSAGWGRGVTPALRILGVPGVGELLGGRRNRELARRMLLSTVCTPAAVTEELVDLHHRMSSQPGAWRVFLRLLRANGSVLGQSPSMFRPLREELRRFDKPVLIIWGDRDRIIPPDHARIAQSALPRAETRLFEGCGHLVMLERPEEYASTILSFMERPFNGTRS